MVPKIIHYCWFGKNKMPHKLVRNINSWEKMNPSFKVIKWDESNFNIMESNKFVKDAYLSENWAFVSDYVRLYAIYNYGGVYLDTDVKLIKSLDQVLLRFPNGFMGYEDEDYVASGLGFAAEEKNKIIGEMLQYYNTISFDQNNKDDIACPIINTKILRKHGLLGNNKKQKINNITILPMEYLCPKNLEDGKVKITNNTISIHEYNASWMSFHKRSRIKIILFVKKILPLSTVNKLRRVFSRNDQKNFSK